MPRYYRRRGSRRYKRKTLTKSNIYSKTSARSQSRQIYALKRRVSALSRINRPEIKIRDGTVQTFTMSSGTWTDSYKSYLLPWPSQGTQDDQRTGSAFRIKNLMIRINMEYYNNSATGYHTSESAGTPVRIIVIRTVGPVAASFDTSLDNLLEHSGYGGSDYTARAISPFKRAVTQQFKIVYNKLVYLTSDKNQRSVFISTGRNRQIEFNMQGLAPYYVVYIAPAGLHYDDDFKEYIQGTMVYRCSYTDV